MTIDTALEKELATTERVCERLVKAQLTALYFRILRALSKKYQNVTDIANLCGTSKAAATTLIDRMEKRGLVHRERLGKDRRVVMVQITPEGKSALEAVPATR